MRNVLLNIFSKQVFIVAEESDHVLHSNIQVLSELSRILESEVEMPLSVISRIVSEVVSLSELEPCGVRGGTIVVMFSSEPQPVGRIQVDPSTVPTFQLILNILPQTDFRQGLKS